MISLLPVPMAVGGSEVFSSDGAAPPLGDTLGRGVLCPTAVGVTSHGR